MTGSKIESQFVTEYTSRPRMTPVSGDGIFEVTTVKYERLARSSENVISIYAWQRLAPLKCCNSASRGARRYSSLWRNNCSCERPGLSIGLLTRLKDIFHYCAVHLGLRIPWVLDKVTHASSIYEKCHSHLMLLRWLVT